jgi:hypothetical protein
MGLEPTTFCMASGSWVWPAMRAIAVFMRDCAASRTCCAPFLLVAFPGDSRRFGQQEQIAAQKATTVLPVFGRRAAPRH